MQSFRLCHFQDIKVARVAKFAKFQTLSSSGYHIKVARVGTVTKFQSYHFQDIKVARVAKVAKFQTFVIFRISAFQGLQRLQSFRLVRLPAVQSFLNINFKFQTLSFSGYQGCESCKVSHVIIFRISYQGCKGCKGCKFSDFVIFGISRF